MMSTPRQTIDFNVPGNLANCRMRDLRNDSLPEWLVVGARSLPLSRYCPTSHAGSQGYNLNADVVNNSTIWTDVSGHSISNAVNSFLYLVAVLCLVFGSTIVAILLP